MNSSRAHPCAAAAPENGRGRADCDLANAALRRIPVRRRYANAAASWRAGRGALRADVAAARARGLSSNRPVSRENLLCAGAAAATTTHPTAASTCRSCGCATDRRGRSRSEHHASSRPSGVSATCSLRASTRGGNPRAFKPVGADGCRVRCWARNIVLLVALVALDPVCARLRCCCISCSAHRIRPCRDHLFRLREDARWRAGRDATRRRPRCATARLGGQNSATRKSRTRTATEPASLFVRGNARCLRRRIAAPSAAGHAGALADRQRRRAALDSRACGRRALLDCRCR